MSEPAPMVVGEAGRLTVVDNLTEGQGIDFAKQFTAVFGADAVAHFTGRSPRPQQRGDVACQPSSSSRSDAQ